MTKILCEQCNRIGYLQRIGNNYYRIRHYPNLDPATKKPIFVYHEVSKVYAEDQITQLSNIDQQQKANIEQLVRPNIDQLKGSMTKIKAFQP
jgi:hypothetical protein